MCREEEEGEERLPKMIKYGSMKDQNVSQFHNTQKFTPIAASRGRPLPEIQETQTTEKMSI